MQRLFENAKTNSILNNKHGYRHDNVIKRFAASLFCLVGKSGYELLLANLGNALPSITTVQRISTHKRIKEGEFCFDQLKDQLKDRNAVPYVHIRLDDSRIINKVEYDPSTDRFVGFCKTLNDGLPICNAFILNTFEEIKEAVENKTISKYAHCIVAQPVDGIAPASILFVLGTDSKYTHELIIERWNSIEKRTSET